ncbi:MAG: amidohydrolase family protein [Oscillospiraceae bacterium]|nr:amidohydrolase family protein [Oscillospiraceae bacterium]
MNKILIKGGMLHTMQEPLFCGDVLVDDGKIAAVGPSLEAKDAQIIDASGLHVLPGLIDAHSHIGLFDFNHDKSVDDANEMTDPVSAAMDARYGMNPKARELQVAYEHGITSMLFTPGSGDVFCGQPFVAKTYGDNIFDMTVKAPAAVKIALGGNPKNTFGALKRMPMTRMGVAHVLWDTFRRAKTYLENQEQNIPQDYDPQLEAILPALRGEVPCKIHCTQYDMLTAIEVAKAFGVRFSLEHAWGASDYLEELVDSGCDICYGPIATYRAPGERRRVDVEAVKLLDERGVNVALVTDSPILSEESLYHHMGEAVREGADPERVLRMVTINPALQLGLEQRLGSLAPGRDADIILVKGFLGLDTDAKVQLTMVDGRIVYQL